MKRRILRHLQSVRPSQRIVAVIQARLGSRRFPRKSLALFRGRPIIEHVIERVCRMPLVDEVVVAVPTKDADLIDAVTRYGSRLINTDAGRRPVSVVCGPEKDVLMRYWLACTAHKADVVIRITGDCPMWSSRAGEEVLRAFLDDPEERQFWSNDTTQSGWPDGTDAEVFSMELLTRAKKSRSLTVGDCEHVTTWMKRTVYPDVGIVRRKIDALSSLKLSVDTRSDLSELESINVDI